MQRDHESPVPIATESTERSEWAGGFPWSGRTLAEWQALASRDITALVRAAASAAGTHDYLDSTFLACYDLTTAVSCLSDQDTARISQQEAHPDGRASRGPGLVEAVLPHVLPAIELSFEGPAGCRLITFLGALKKTRAQQLQQERESVAATWQRGQSIPPAPASHDHALVREALAQLHWSPEQGREVLTRYRQLQTGLAPLYETLTNYTRREASTWSINQDREDRVGYALLRCVEVLVTFNWEPVILDPEGTTAHFIRRAMKAAFRNHTDATSDSRGIEERQVDVTLGTASGSVEAQTIERQSESEVQELIGQAVGTDPQKRTIAIGHILRGTSLPQLADDLGLSHDQTTRIWLQIRQRLQTAVQNQAAAMDEHSAIRPSNSSRGRYNASSLWGELATRRDHYAELLGRLGKSCLLNMQYEVFEAALANTTGERNSTIRATATALGGKYTEALIRRQIALSADLLERKGSLGRSDGGWLTKEGEWLQRRQALMQLRTDHTFWNSLVPELQELAERYYFQPTERPNQAVVGKQLSCPVDASNVSRRLAKLDKIVALQRTGALGMMVG